MKSGKRILAGILAAIMVLSSAQLPGDISHAEELPATQESITAEESGRRGRGVGGKRAGTARSGYAGGDSR